jgi:heat shock protein HslJ
MKTILLAAGVALCASCNMATDNNSSSNDSTSGMISKDSTAMSISAPTADTFSINGAWFLQPVLASDTATGNIPTLIFNLEKNKFSGNTGCNNMNGSFKKTDSSLVFDENIETTRMVCAGYNEDAFIKSLLRTNKYKFDNGVLVLLFESTELSRWTRRPEKELKVKRT